MGGSGELHRVALRFSDGTEIRYAILPPAHGQRIRNRHGEKELVVRVQRDDSGYIVHCLRLADYTRQVRLDARDTVQRAAVARERAAELRRKLTSFQPFRVFE